jgi:hypothetical protein
MRAVCIALSALCVAGVASAQDTVELNQAETRRIMDKFADCVVQRHHDAARDFALTRIGASNSSHWPDIYDSICLKVDTNLTDGGVTLRTPAQEMRFALAQALIPRDLAKFDPKQIAAVLPGAVEPNSAAKKDDGNKAQRSSKGAQGESDRERAFVLLDAYSDCVVRQNPYGVRDLLNTRLNGNDEELAFQAMMPALGACLDRGKQFGTDRTTLRGSLALSYYRLALASKVGSSEVAK